MRCRDGRAGSDAALCGAGVKDDGEFCKPDSSAFHTSDCGEPAAVEPGPDPICGNDITAGVEVCDGVDLRGASCVGLGYAEGDLDCKPDCTAYDLGHCA